MPSQSQRWPADRAILFVHGVGNAQPGSYEPLVSQVRTILGPDAEQFAFYFLYYDELNQWAAAKLNASQQVAAAVGAIRSELATSALSIGNIVADFAGDVIWPVLIADVRNAIRASYVSQLQQIVLDGKEDGKRKARDLHITIIAHSLGCFHTYEALHEVVADAGLGLAPATWNTRIDNVIYMASPVQLIRHVAGKISLVVPDRAKLYCLAPAGLTMPAERDALNEPVPLVRNRTVSITGNLDPVGGHFFRAKTEWAYMQLPGEGFFPIIDQQQIATVPGLGEEQSLGSILQEALANGEAPRITPNNPHSWSDYVDRHAADLRTWLTA
jgi:hypothetical protein